MKQLHIFVTFAMLCAIALAFSSSCSLLIGKKQVKISGNTAVWPKDTDYWTPLADMKLVKFEAAYPQDWPSGFDLPPVVYAPEDESLSFTTKYSDDPRMQKSISSGIARMEHIELMEFFKSQIDGLQPTSYDAFETPSVPLDDGKKIYPEMTNLIAEGWRGDGSGITVMIEKNPDVAGYTAFAVIISYLKQDQPDTH